MCVSIVNKHCHVNKELHAQQIRLRQHISPLKQRYIIQSWQSVNTHERHLLVSFLQEKKSDNIKLPIDGEIASRGMHICYAIFAGISLRLCSISLRSLRITFAAYLPTHIKSLRDFFQSLLNNHRDNLYIIS